MKFISSSSLIIIFKIHFIISSSLSSFSNQNDSSLKDEDVQTETEKASRWLERFHSSAGVYYNDLQKSNWDHETSLTLSSQNRKISAKQNFTNFMFDVSQEAQRFNVCAIEDYDVQRLIKKLQDAGKSIYSENTIARIEKLISYMTTVYGTTKICKYQEWISEKECIPKLELEPDIENVMAKSRDPEELLYTWRAWTNQIGRNIREYFIKATQSVNQLGFKDIGQVWIDQYETSHFEDVMEDLMRKLMPFYELLHAYVRKRLHTMYGPENINLRDAIPAHLLGNMWAQDWYNLYEDTIPFPNISTINLTILEKKSPLELFQMADKFFQSLGFEPMTQEFWNNSIFTKPLNGSFVCHATATDFFDGKDFRIKMCTESNFEHFMIIHHEMGHIQYFMQYKHLPYLFRTGSNPGFHEAIGNLIALSVQTPQHLASVGLLNITGDADPENKRDINMLYKVALREIAFLPFGLSLDLWRYKLSRQEIKYCHMNRAWWDLRKKYQGVRPWEDRAEENFDAGAKFHVAAFIPYMRYFISFMLEYQFHERLCQIAEYNGPLHRCDISQSKVSGYALREMLKYGSSRPWQYVMKQFVGTSDLNPDAALNYFEPLIEWLKKNLTHDYVGWGYDWKAKCRLKSLEEQTFRIAKSGSHNRIYTRNYAYAGDGLRVKCPLNYKLDTDATYVICSENGKWIGNGCYSKDLPHCVKTSGARDSRNFSHGTIFLTITTTILYLYIGHYT